LHDLGLSERYMAEERFEVDGAKRSPRVPQGARYRDLQLQLVWDAIALHTTRSIALHKEPEVARPIQVLRWTLSGLVSIEFRRINYRRSSRGSLRLALKNQFQSSLCNIVRRKPATSFDNILRDFGTRYVGRVHSSELRGRRRKLAVF